MKSVPYENEFVIISTSDSYNLEYSAPKKYFLEVPPFFKGSQGASRSEVLKKLFWSTISIEIISFIPLHLI